MPANHKLNLPKRKSLRATGFDQCSTGYEEISRLRHIEPPCTVECQAYFSIYASIRWACGCLHYEAYANRPALLRTSKKGRVNGPARAFTRLSACKHWGFLIGRALTGSDLNPTPSLVLNKPKTPSQIVLFVFSKPRVDLCEHHDSPTCPCFF